MNVLSIPVSIKSTLFQHLEIKPDVSLFLEICLTFFLKEKSTSAHLSCQLCPSNAKLFAESVENTSAAGRTLLTHCQTAQFWDKYCKTTSFWRWRPSVFTSNWPILTLSQIAWTLMHFVHAQDETTHGFQVDAGEKGLGRGDMLIETSSKHSIRS